MLTGSYFLTLVFLINILFNKICNCSSDEGAWDYKRTANALRRLECYDTNYSKHGALHLLYRVPFDGIN